MADFDILRRKGIKIILMETCEQNIKIKYVRLDLLYLESKGARGEHKDRLKNYKTLENSNGYLNVYTWRNQC